jgi:hypothetical protein
MVNFAQVEKEYFAFLNHWQDAERCKLTEKKYFAALTKKEDRTLYGLEVLHANPSCDSPSQHGWSSLFVSIKHLGMTKRYKTIKAIRNIRSAEGRLYFYNINMIDEKDVYAWFYDLVWRQNNQAVLVKDENGNKKAIENFSGRWNKKRPFGYIVRKRLHNVLENIKNPVMLTLTLSDRKIKPLMPYNTNLDIVSFSIANIGKWLSNFNTQLWKLQKKENIPWAFKGWVMEFQKLNNCGFPHPHIIYASDWLGEISKIQELWKLGNVDLTTVKDIQKRSPGKKYDSLRLANYLTKYVSKTSVAIDGDMIHKGYAWLAFTGGRVFAVKHIKKLPEQQENKM